MPIPNHQNLLAKQFHSTDSQVIKANNDAFMQIKRWKYLRVSTLNETIIKEADNMIYDSLLAFIDTKQVLYKEGYFESELFN